MKEKIKRLAVKSLLSVLAVALLIVGYYFVYLYCGYQRIKDNLQLEISDNTATEIPVNEELTLITYNVGFAAYYDGFSFFMDGGEYGKAVSKEFVEQDLDEIIKTLKRESADIMLLQETDIDGTRSYNIDQTAVIAENFTDYDTVVTVNYDSPYFFYPFHDPMGKNKSGTMTMSRYNISSSLRRSLPVEESLYRYLDLDRAYTVSRMETTGEKTLVLYNLHFSAYTSDNRIADAQLKMMLEDMNAEYEKGNYVIAAGDFNKDLLGDSSQYFERREGDYLWAESLNFDLFYDWVSLHTGTNVPSCRNADSPYRGDGTDFVLTVDGMLTSPNVRVLSSETIDEGFRNSDHNPVKFTVILEDTTEETE